MATPQKETKTKMKQTVKTGAKPAAKGSSAKTQTATKETKPKKERKKRGQFTEPVLYQGRIWEQESLKNYKEYQTAFMKETYRTFVFRVTRNKEDAIIEHLESQENLTEYIKRLVLLDMEKSQKRK